MKGGDTCVVMQPTYLPWIGYFDLLDQADVFVLLDDVQLSPRSWQQRNRIKGPEGLRWLSVPVRHVSRRQTIQETRIADHGFAVKHIRSLEHCYRRAPFFETIMPGVRQLLEPSLIPAGLSELNENLIRWIAGELGIGTTILRASDLNVGGNRSSHLAALCHAVGARRYLSPLGSASYLVDDLSIFDAFGLQVAFQNFTHPTYSQLFPPFCSHASVLDLLFNEYPDALDIIRRGRKEPLAVDDLRRLVKRGELP